MKNVQTLQDTLEARALNKLKNEANRAITDIQNLYGQIEHETRWSIPMKMPSGADRKGPVVEINAYSFFEAFQTYIVQHLINARIEAEVGQFISQVDQVASLAHEHQE